MRKVSLCVFAGYGLSVVAYAAAPTLAANPSLGAVLQKLSSSAPAAEVDQIERAIHASPALLGQLNALASSGKLKTITVKSGEVAVAKNGASFGAAFDAHGMVFSEVFLGKQSQMAYDVRIPNEKLPNNTTFVLGHLAYHLRDAQYAEHAVKLAPSEKLFLSGVMRNEAGAFIQGWNDVVDAATVSNGNKPLLPGEVGELLINLRYRYPFIKAMEGKGDHKLDFSNGGRIEASNRNLSVMAAALGDSPMGGVE